MRRSVCALLGLIVVCWTCGRVSSDNVSSDNVVFEAKVTDTAGAAINYGHVLLYDSENGSVIGSEEFGEQGSFRIEISRPHIEPRYIRVVAPFYKTIDFPFVVLSGTRSVEALVVLASNVKLRPEHVQIGIGDLDPIEMERRADGAFVYSLDESEGPVSYYVTGASVEEGRRRLPGSQRDRFSLALNSLPPYYSAIIEEPNGGGLSEIVYDPSVLPWTDFTTRSSVLPKDETLNAVVDIASERDLAMDVIMLYFRANRQYDIHDVMARTYARVRAALASDTEELRAYAAAEVFDSFLAEVVTDEDRKLALQALPIESPYWGWVRGLWRLPSKSLVPVEVLESLASANRHRRVRAYAVAALAWAAKEKEDRATWIERYRELEEYADVGGALPGILERLNPETRIAVGKSVPSFNLALFDGVYRGSDFISDEAFSGMTYVLDFWGTWCPACVAAMPELHTLWQLYGGPGFQIMSLAVDDSADSIQRFRKEHWPMPWLHVLLEGDLGRSVLEHFEVTSYPTTILVDSSGAIVSLKNANEGLAEAVEALGIGVSVLDESENGLSEE